MASPQNVLPALSPLLKLSAENPNLKSIDELRQWLQPTDYLSPGNEYMKHLHSYVPGTGDWLRESEDFRRWEDGTERGCLWVKGIPGSGKSVFAASTVRTLAETQDSEAQSAPALFFFFRQIVEKNHDPKYLVRDWVAQLLPSSRDLREKLHELSNQHGVEGIEQTKLWDTLVEALDGMTKVYCVADALDEMDDQNASFIEKLRELGLRRPEKIKVLLTSRPIPRIEKQLRHPEVEAVKLDPRQIYPDIVCYIASRLEGLEPRLSAETEGKVKEAICDRAEGLFLYARLIMDSLTEGLREGSIIEDTLPTSLEHLPLNLKELYTRMLVEHSRRSGVTQEQQFTILQCVVYASRPLRLIELGSIIAHLRKDTGAGLKEGKDLVRQACGRLLEILEDESVSVIHHSFTEFARDQSRSGEPGAFPVLNESESQRMMLQVCLQYLDSCEMSESVADRLEHETSEQEEEEEYDDDLDRRSVKSREDERKHHQIQDLRSTYPLIDYATQNLTYHIEKSEAANLGVFDLLDSYFAPGNRAFEIWLLIQWDQYRKNNVQPLHIAAYLGLTGYTRHLITSGSSVNARDGEGRTPLLYATEEGHVDIASLLLTNGADPDSNDRVGYKPLHLAAQKNRVEITRMLLAAGVSPKTKKTRNSPELYLEQLGSDLGETPLQYACSRGYIEILNQFIDCISEEDACRCLHWTVNSYNPAAPEAMEAILKTGKAPVDVLVDGVTALVHAADLMKPNLIRVLLRYGADPNFRVEKEHWYHTDSPDAKIKYKAESADGPTAMHAFAGIRSNTSISGDKKRGEECLKLLVDAGGDVNARTLGSHTPLHYAVKTRSIMWGEWSGEKTEGIVTELLLQYGAYPNARCRAGATPLHKLDASRPELVDILIRNGADVNAKNNKGSTPLLSIVSTISNGWTGGYGATKPEVVQQTISKLLEHGADVQVENNDGGTIFHYMFAGMEMFQSGELWKRFIKGGADLNKPNKFGKPPLLSMKEKHHGGAENEKLFQMLVEEGLQPSITDSKDNTVLFSLLDTYDVKLASVQKLLNLGCSVKAKDEKGATLLHRCMKRDSQFEIFELLVKAGADPTAVDNDGNTILHVVASNHPGSRFSTKMKTLVDMGVPTDTPNQAGRTPLHVACAVATESFKTDRAKEFLDLLLDGKLCLPSNVNALDSLEASPIHYAASFSEFHVGYLLRAGAEPALKTPEGLTPLHIAARGRASNVIGVLLSEYRKRGILELMINDTDNNGCAALHYACRSGRPESVSYLLSAGANISARDKVGRTPLHALAEFPEEDLLWTSALEGDLPIDFDAACVTLGDLGRPCSSQHPTIRDSDPARTRDILVMLENAGADLQATWMVDGEERTPMDVSLRTKCTEMVNELRDRGLTAKDPATEALIPKPAGMKEAKILLGRVDPPGRGGRHTSEDGRPSKKQHLEKFQEILKGRDYNLFDEFVKIGGDLLACGGWRHFTGLHALVEWGHAGLLEKFSDEAARVDDQNYMVEEENPGTLLCHACEQALPRLDVIKVLVEKVKVDVNWISNRYGYIYKGSKATALHWLAAGTHFWNIEAIEYLLDQGADIEARNAHGETPLMAAVGSEHPNGFWKEETMRLLLERGANPNILRNNGNTCLNMSDHANVTRLLLQHGADISVGKTSPLTSAVKAMDVDAARLLLEAGANPNKGYPVHEAARPNDKNEEVDPIWSQCQREMIVLLLEHGADPFALDDDGSSVLQKVTEEHGILDLFWELPNFPVELRGEGGRTPLISTCYPTITPAPPYYGFNKPKPKRACIPEAALKLIEKGADVAAKDDLGRTALHWLCTLSEELGETHQNLFKILINRSPSLIQTRDSQGFKPFHVAAANSHTHIWITDYLIFCGFDPKEPDPAGNNILHYLAPQLLGEKTKALAATECFKNFLSLGLSIDYRNDLGETSIFRFMSTSWKGTYGPSGSSHPTWAIENDISHVKALPIFLEAGADLQTRNAQEENLLHVTAKRWRKKSYVEGDQQEDMLDIFKELMARGLDPRAEDAKFRTAIDVAVASSNLFLVNLFGVKERGAKKVKVSDTEDEEEESEDETDEDEY